MLLTEGDPVQAEIVGKGTTTAYLTLLEYRVNQLIALKGDKPDPLAMPPQSGIPTAKKRNRKALT